MPSLNRPNAPNRLPSSDFENLFSRPRVLRASDPSPNITISPLSFPTSSAGTQPRKRRTLRSSEYGGSNPTSPLLSPGIGTAQRRAELPDRQVHVSGLSGEVYFPSALTPEAIEEKPTSLKHRSSSTISFGARESLRVLDVRVSPSPSKHEQPPHEARSGFGWKRDFLGGWLEIRVGRRSDGPSRALSEEMAPPVLSYTSTMELPLTTPITRVQTAHDLHWSNPASDQRLLEDSPEPDTALPTPKEGLYCLAKRALGLKRNVINPTDASSRTRTPTGNVLDIVSSTLREVAVKRLMSSYTSSTATSVSNLSIAAPRHRRSGPHRVYTTSSSIRDVMMGKPPVPTPEPEAMYTGADSQQHLAVELSGPDNTSFLPSEARRINTPPLPDNSCGKSKLRGFFFDYSVPPAQGFLPHRSTPGEYYGRSSSVSDKEWYRRKLDAIDSEPTIQQEPWEEFVSSIPDHLPNSPLCPRHPKHKSKGKGVCPYHGKNKVSPPDVTTPTLKDEKLSPSQNWWYA